MIGIDLILSFVLSLSKLGLCYDQNYLTVFNYKQQFEAVKTVLNGMAEFALIDGLSLVNEEKVLKHPDLEIKEFLDDNQYYGVIVSGKTEKLGNCINVYMRTNKVEIQQKVGSHFGSLWDVSKFVNRFKFLLYNIYSFACKIFNSCKPFEPNSLQKPRATMPVIELSFYEQDLSAKCFNHFTFQLSSTHFHAKKGLRHNMFGKRENENCSKKVTTDFE